MFSSSVSASVILDERFDTTRAAARPVEFAADDAAGKSLADRPAAPTASAAGLDGTQPSAPADITSRAVEAAFARTRILDWAERLRSADGAVAVLIARPDPDGRRPSYPSATEAYREIAEVVGAL